MSRTRDEFKGSRPTQRRDGEGQLTEEANRAETAAEVRPIWEEILELADSLPPEVVESLPTDAAEEHDHYIYGWPKRKK